MSESMTRHIDRPIHPWSERLSELPEGKGDFYHWGPNYTVDPVVLAGGEQPSVLLILRKKDLQWALPGGFIDPEDASEAVAARRELFEEAGLELDETDPVKVYQGPVEDPRSTRSAWPETSALLWRIDSRQPLQAGDDAVDAMWALLGELPSDLYGSHASIIEQAVIDHGSIREQLAYFGERCEITLTTGGHMNYDRHIVSLPTGTRAFVKRHNHAAFTDAEREAHSREYLRKEYEVYRQLNTQTNHVPRALELVDDHTLVLEACDPRDGWLWRAPRDAELQDRYIREVLAALDEIETLTFSDTSAVLPNYIAIEQDGWDEVTAHRDEIKTLLRRQDSPHGALLADMLDELQQAHSTRTIRPRTALAHADLRQSNLAWHPTEGVKIVDWSWAGPSSPGLDKTSFLIDLAKSGVDITRYVNHFDTVHARKLMGFWLGRAIQPALPGSIVREHQLASAITAFELLCSSSNDMIRD